MEFDETDEFGSLMRANTAISRMMTTYTRFLWQQEISLLLLFLHCYFKKFAK